MSNSLTASHTPTQIVSDVLLGTSIVGCVSGNDVLLRHFPGDVVAEGHRGLIEHLDWEICVQTCSCPSGPIGTAYLARNEL